jgi:ActR/RegA family two-component response regulator
MPDETVLAPGCEILLLEDDAPLRKRLAGYLRGLGAEVSEAARLAEARHLLHELRFEFALVDLHLPDGEVLELLREGAFSENTGVVVMTAFGGVRKAVEAMRLGAGDYLAKPRGERSTAPRRPRTRPNGSFSARASPSSTRSSIRLSPPSDGWNAACRRC